MKHSLMLFLICVLIAPLAHAQRILGNGGMAISFSEKGQLESLLWPGPGGAEQLHRNGSMFFANPVASELHGAQWGIDLGGGIEWQEHNTNDVTWDASRISAICRYTASNGIACTQSVLVLPAANVVALQLKVQSDNVSDIFWFQDFNPTLAQVVAWPGASDLFSSARDFAAFFDKETKTLYQFRPKDPSSEDREKAEMPTGTSALPEFADGVWIGTASAESITNNHCISMPVKKEILDTPGLLSVYGDAAAFLQIEASVTHSATLFIAIGESKAKVDESLAAVRGQSFEALVQQEKSAWDTRIAGHLPEGKVEGAQHNKLEEAVAFLFNVRDAASGAYVHAPLPGGPANSINSSVWPCDVAWITEALLVLKMPDEAGKHLDFCLHAVNAHSSPERPAGTLPFALYTNGRHATLPSIVDTKASAETLIALWRYAQGTIAGGAYPKPEYLPSTRPTVELLAHFLAMQFSNAEENIAPSFQPQELRDAKSSGTLTMVYLGLLAAKEILTLQGEEFPLEWARSLKTCESQIRFAILNETTPWPLSAEVIHWMELLLPQDHPLWKAPIAIHESLKTLGQLRTMKGTFFEGGQIKDSLQAAMAIVEKIEK